MTQACLLCESGKYMPNDGASACHPSPAGTYTFSQGATLFATCSAGTYSDVVGRSQCTSCEDGKYGPNIGLTSCLSTCTSGFYSAAAGTGLTSAPANSCNACGEGYSTGVDGGVGIDTKNACVCDVGYGRLSKADDCVQCLPTQYCVLATSGAQWSPVEHR